MWWEIRTAGMKSEVTRVAAAKINNPAAHRSHTIFPTSKSCRPACPSTTRVPTAIVTSAMPAAKNKCIVPIRAAGQSADATQPANKPPTAQRTALPGVLETLPRRNTGVSSANQTTITPARSTCPAASIPQTSSAKLPYTNNPHPTAAQNRGHQPGGGVADSSNECPLAIPKNRGSRYGPIPNNGNSGNPW